MATWFAAFGALSCGGSEPSNGGNAGGSGGAGGAGGGGGSAGTDAGSAGDSGSGVSAEQACTETASALCSKFESCAPFAITIFFGDLAGCNAVAKTGCLGSLQATKTAATADAYMKCSQDLKMAACSEILAHQSPSSCRPKGGTVGNGMACGDDWQCMSGHCAIPDNATCGVCASLAPAGGSCPGHTDDECEYGQVCADNLLCVTPAAAGGSCDASHPCVNPLVCIGATTTTQGTCTTGGAPGASCTSDQGCSVVQGLWCTRETNRTCGAIIASDPGGRCGFLSVSEFALCKGGGGGGGCNVATGSAAGTCPRLGMPGEACGATAPCKAGAKCVNGLCAVRDPAACR
jgi:hypothetical protein